MPPSPYLQGRSALVSQLTHSFQGLDPGLAEYLMQQCGGDFLRTCKFISEEVLAGAPPPRGDAAATTATPSATPGLTVAATPSTATSRVVATATPSASACTTPSAARPSVLSAMPSLRSIERGSSAPGVRPPRLASAPTQVPAQLRSQPVAQLDQSRASDSCSSGNDWERVQRQPSGSAQRPAPTGGASFGRVRPPSFQPEMDEARSKAR